ncbi:MAG: hypothetical protein ACM3ZA_09230 [Bacillota bacterium]
MKTYETVCDLLLNAVEDAGMSIASVEHYIETITLDKEFIFVCVPEGQEDAPRVRAEISFIWDSTMTAASVYGQGRGPHGSGPDLQLDAPSLNLDVLPINAQPVMELYVKYQFEVPSAERVPELADRLRSILRGVISHENFPEVRFEVSVLPDGKVAVDDAFAFYWWQVDLGGDVEREFEDITGEVRQVLSALQTADLGG